VALVLATGCLSVPGNPELVADASAAPDGDGAPVLLAHWTMDWDDGTYDPGDEIVGPIADELGQFQATCDDCPTAYADNGPGSLRFGGGPFLRIEGPRGPLDLASSGTISLWVTTTSSAPAGTLVARSSEGAWPWALAIVADGAVELRRGNATIQTDGEVIEVETWRAIGATWSDGSGRIYVDGELAASGPLPDPLESASGEYLIAAASAAGASPPTAVIDALRLHRGALGAAELGALTRE
jgi:hypothetical protein